MLLIENDGPAIRNTNYWQSEHAKRGFFYLSWNAGAGRLLIPRSQHAVLAEMSGAREVLVSRGPWSQAGGRDALELLWEDGSDNPFCLHLIAAQTDRLIPEEQQGGGFIIAAWTEQGEQARWPGRYRRVDRLPYLLPWEEQ